MIDIYDIQDELIDAVDSIFTIDVEGFTIDYPTLKVLVNYSVEDIPPLYINDYVRVSDSDVEGFNGYKFKVSNIDLDNKIIELTFDRRLPKDLAIFDSAKLHIFTVTDNIYINDYSVDEYPVCIIEVRNSDKVDNGSNENIVGETEYPILMLGSYSNYGVSSFRESGVRECRRSLDKKLLYLLDFLSLRTNEILERGDTVWGTEKVRSVAQVLLTDLENLNI